MNKQEREFYERALKVEKMLKEENEKLHNIIKNLKGFIKVYKSKGITGNEATVINIIENYLKGENYV